MAIEAIIFDFDGVIIDSENSRATKLKELLALHNIEVTREHFKQFRGRTTQSILEADFVAQLNPNQMEDVLERYSDEFKSKITNFLSPINPTIEFIRQSQGKKLAIGSMSPTNVLEEVLGKLEITDKFEVIHGREHASRHKPDPEIYVNTARAMGVDPSKCVVVEDTIIGATAALAAGMDCYILLNGNNSREEFDGMSITNFISSLEDYKQYLE